MYTGRISENVYDVDCHAWEKVNEEQKRLQEEQLRAQEQLIVKLENEKLENDLTYKSKELASATLSVIS